MKHASTLPRRGPHASVAAAIYFVISNGSCIGVERPEVSSMAEVLAAPPGSDQPFDESLQPGPPGDAQVTLSDERRFQTLEGFGASVGWFQDRIAGAVPDGLYQFLFPELGLDIIRFRNRFERSDATDSVLRHETRIYERATEALGYAPRLLLTSWSPPAELKANGHEKCKGNPDCTLKRENGEFVYARFADWWKRSVEHYRSLGMNPYWVSIQNEPSFVPPDWEGCKFEPDETADYPGYGKALEAVHASLQTLDEAPRLLGPEVLGVHNGRVQKYLAGMNLDLVDVVAHHLYERGEDQVWDWKDPGPDSYADEMTEVGKLTDKPLLQTEFGTDEDEGILGGFETAWLIHHSLVAEGSAGFLYWELIWPGKGLVSMKGLTPEPRDHYYSLRHFARFTDPGYVRVDAISTAPDLLASAYVSPNRERLTAVLLNTSQRVTLVRLDAGSFGSAKVRAFVTGYRPGKSQRWHEVEGSATGELRMPARAVATLVYDR